MPPREDFAGRRQAILEAATRVFASKGYAATNREIAAAAGVTAAALYWYFPSKMDLFRAVIDQVRGLAEEQLVHLDGVDDRPPRETLLRLAGGMLAVLSRPPARDVLRMMLLEFTRYPELKETYFRAVVYPVATRVFAYFQRQVDRGVLRPLPAPDLALSFIGPLMATVILHEVLGQNFPPVDLTTFVGRHVETFLNGALGDSVAVH